MWENNKFKVLVLIPIILVLSFLFSGSRSTEKTQVKKPQVSSRKEDEIKDDETAKYLNSLDEVFHYYRDVKILCEKQKNCSMGIPLDHMKLFQVYNCCAEKEQLAKKALAKMDEIKSNTVINEESEPLDNLLRVFFKKVIEDSQKNSSDQCLKNLTAISPNFSRINIYLNDFKDVRNPDRILQLAMGIDEEACDIRRKINEMNLPEQYNGIRKDIDLYCDSVNAAAKKIEVSYDNLVIYSDPEGDFSKFKEKTNSTWTELQKNSFYVIDPEIIEIIGEVPLVIEAMERNCTSSELMPIRKL